MMDFVSTAQDRQEFDREFLNLHSNVVKTLELIMIFLDDTDLQEARGEFFFLARMYAGEGYLTTLEEFDRIHPDIKGEFNVR